MRKRREKAQPLPESREALLADLERQTGRTFRTHDDVRTFVAEIDAERMKKQARSAGIWRTVKSTTLLVLLVLAVAQFYFTDTLLQMVSLRENTFFVPVKTNEVRSAAPVSDRG
jgi:hypothetical protein